MSLRTLNKAEAVEAAKALFWRKGYGDTSMAELVEVTGMNRYALYSVFGSKREVFLAALEVYFEEGRAHYEPLMRDRAVPPLERIRSCLEAFAQQMREQRNGCLICHVAAEHRSDDPLVAAAVASYFEKIRELIEVPLTEAAEAGALNPGLTPQVAAQLVFDAKMSMGVHARAGVDPAMIDRIPTATMAALGAPAAPAARSLARPKRTGPKRKENAPA